MGHSDNTVLALLIIINKIIDVLEGEALLVC